METIFCHFGPDWPAKAKLLWNLGRPEQVQLLGSFKKKQSNSINEVSIEINITDNIKNVISEAYFINP